MTVEATSWVLVFTHTQDPTRAELLQRTRLRTARGPHVWRLVDTDLFPTQVRLTLHDGDGGPGEVARAAVLHLPARDGEPAVSLSFADVHAGWNRRFAPPRLPADLDPEFARVAGDESELLLRSMLDECLGARLVDDRWLAQRMEHKTLGHALAQRCGLRTPRTIISNSPDALRAFVRSCGAGGCILKPLTTYIDPAAPLMSGVLVTSVSIDDFSDDDSLRLYPMMLQEKIEKSYELRVTIVGKRLFTLQLDSQATTRGQTDWRRGYTELRPDQRTIAALPEAVEAALLRYVDACGLNYAACDLIVTPTGEHVFLEANPAGEFYFVEESTGEPIYDAVFDLVERHDQWRKPVFVLNM